MGRFTQKGHTRGEWGFTVGFVVAGWGGLKRRREREQGKVLAERAARAKRNIYPGTQNMKVWDARGKMATRSIPLVSQFLLLEVTSSSIPSVSSVLSSSFLWTAAHLWTLPVFSTFSPQLSPPGRPFWQFFTPREQLATCSSHFVGSTFGSLHTTLTLALHLAHHHSERAPPTEPLGRPHHWHSFTKAATLSFWGEKS